MALNSPYLSHPLNIILLFRLPPFSLHNFLHSPPGPNHFTQPFLFYTSSLLFSPLIVVPSCTSSADPTSSVFTTSPFNLPLILRYNRSNFSLSNSNFASSLHVLCRNYYSTYIPHFLALIHIPSFFSLQYIEDNNLCLHKPHFRARCEVWWLQNEWVWKKHSTPKNLLLFFE